MFLLKQASTKILIIELLFGCGALLATQYHKPDLFPIGFSGIGSTGYATDEGQPYPDTLDYGEWYKETDLLELTHCNFIGCSDGGQYAYLNFASPNKYDFYNQVCLNADSAIYLAPNNTYCPLYCDRDGNGRADSVFYEGDTFVNPCGDTIVVGSGTTLYEYRSLRHYRWSSVFRNWWPCGRGGDGEMDTVFWPLMADSAATIYDRYFDSTEVEDSRFWGYNCFVEDPGMYNVWKNGIADADNRITDSIRTRETTGSDGLSGTHRMIIAKGQIYPFYYDGMDVNLFAKVPEIDALLIYTYMTLAYIPYGSQSFFDEFLYQYHTINGTPIVMSGLHNAGKYMQKYGKTLPLRNGQKRRWMACIEINWEFTWEDNTEKILSRRPCPPEIRAMTYLALSRGAKGILYVNYYNYKYRKDADGTYTNQLANIFPDSANMPTIDSGYTGSHTARSGALGLRDATSKPCDTTIYSGPVLLDVPDGQTTYWDGKPDHTFGYICHLIPEIKAISDVLMQLDWVNAYSLNSTAPEWRSTCPHYYVDTVIGAEYVDLGFFRHSSNGVDYFMVVNREGIADMTNREINVVLHVMTMNQLLLTDMADSTNPDTLAPDSGYYFSFTRTFEPGEGKLFRLSRIHGGRLLHLALSGGWREGRVSTGFMQSLQGDGGGGFPDPVLGWALLGWRWLIDKPDDLDSMQLWAKRGYYGEWNHAWTKEGDTATTGTVYPPIPNWKQHLSPMEDSCMYFLEVGNHESGSDLGTFGKGTQSNTVRVQVPGYIYGGCPDLYSFFYQDSAVSPGHVFIENNTILPHSEHYQQMDEDLLRLDVLNDSPDHYYMAIVENDDEASYLDQAKLWVVDHDEGTQVATSADDSIYVYSEMAGPTYCKDNGNNDRLDEVLWEDTLSYGGPEGSYLIVKFDDVEWAHTGLLLSMGNWESGPTPAPKNYLSIPQEPGEGGRWDSLGVAYGRMNHSQWMVDVSDVDSLVFRIMCKGNDTTFIDRIALVKLEGSGWSKQEAALDSATKYDTLGGDLAHRTPYLLYQDTLIETLSPKYPQLSLRFDKVDSSTIYSLRDYVLQSRGYYSTTIDPPLGIEEGPLQFGLRVEQLTPLSRAAVINYSVPYPIHVRIAAYDVVGRLIKCIVDEEVKAGRYSEEWKGKDEAGRTLASGVYFVKMMTEDFEKTTKIVILE